MLSICEISARLTVAGAYVVGSFLSGCNSPVVNPGPTQSAPAGGPAFPGTAQNYPEMTADDAVTIRPQSESYYHEVNSGETLGKIAEKYGVPVDELVRANGLNEPDRIAPGQLIFIPGVNASAKK